MSLPHKVRKTIMISGWSLFGVLVIIVGYMFIMTATNRVPSFFGKSYMRIVSPSMESEIPTNTFIEINKIDASQVKVGDIITFYSTDPAIYNKPNTHRVIAIERSGDSYIYTTKGDNNAIADKYKVESDHLIGIYKGPVPFLTSVGGFFSNNLAFLLIILVPALLMITYEINNVTKKARQLHEETLIEQEIERLRRLDEEKEGESKDDQ